MQNLLDVEYFYNKLSPMKYQIFASGINTYFEQCELLILQNEELIDPKYNTAKYITDNTSLVVFADSGVE